MKRVAVILATRDEANLEYEKGRSFLRWLSSTFSKAGCDPLGVVRGTDADVRERHPDAYLVEVTNGENAVRAGIRAALDDGAEAVLLHSVERPAIRSSTIDKLLKSLEGGDGVVPDFEGAPGQPVVLTRAAAEKLLQLDGEPQVNAIPRRLQLRRVPTRDPGVLVNIDTPDAYERLLGSKPHLAPLPKRRGAKKTMDAGDGEPSHQG
ncbi:MAG TPA: NTP transferase domain-containing protein [Myxococcaceae bacterium]|jgi:molybdenum cofactor cytidylyltransferase|nr:NTP transferase domain-containing protein [Myxococcaceae bacterium]HZA49971.1 NTP transferase domain-containing protein [Myxococcaceae bacterium]